MNRNYPMFARAMISAAGACMAFCGGAHAAGSSITSFASLQDYGQNCYVLYDSTSPNGTYQACGGFSFASGAVSGSPAVLAEESSDLPGYEAHEVSIASPDGSLEARFDTTDSAAFSGTAHPEVSDTLHVVIAGANASTLTDLRFYTGLQADLSGLPSGSGSAINLAEFSYAVTGGVSTESIFYQLYTSANGLGTDIAGAQAANFVSSLNAVGGSFGGYLDVTVQGATADLSVYSDLQCSSGQGGQCDATVGAGAGYPFGLQVQPGVAVSSASHAFPLFIQGSGAPEPASWALMMIGLGVVGAMARNGRSKLNGHGVAA